MIGSLFYGLHFIFFSSSDIEEWLSNVAEYYKQWSREGKGETMKVSLALDMQNAQAGKEKSVSNFIRKFWTAFEQGIRKNTQM